MLHRSWRDGGILRRLGIKYSYSEHAVLHAVAGYLTDHASFSVIQRCTICKWLEHSSIAVGLRILGMMSDNPAILSVTVPIHGEQNTLSANRGLVARTSEERLTGAENGEFVYRLARTSRFRGHLVHLRIVIEDVGILLAS